MLRIVFQVAHFLAFPIMLGLWLHSWQAFGISFVGFLVLLIWTAIGVNGGYVISELGIVAGTFVFGLAWGIVGWACGTLVHVGGFSIVLGTLNIQATAFSVLGGALGIVTGIIGQLALIAQINFILEH